MTSVGWGCGFDSDNRGWKKKWPFQIFRTVRNACARTPAPNFLAPNYIFCKTFEASTTYSRLHYTNCKMITLHTRSYINFTRLNFKVYIWITFQTIHHLCTWPSCQAIGTSIEGLWDVGSNLGRDKNVHIDKEQGCLSLTVESCKLGWVTTYYRLRQYGGRFNQSWLRLA